MIRTRDVILSGLMIAAVVWTFQVKQKTRNAAKNVASLQKQIDQEKARIDLLKADWAVLTQPLQMQEMEKRFSTELMLQPLEPGQIATEDELPPIKIPDDPIGVIARGGGDIDAVITGSIGRRKK